MRLPCQWVLSFFSVDVQGTGCIRARTRASFVWACLWASVFVSAYWRAAGGDGQDDKERVGFGVREEENEGGNAEERIKKNKKIRPVKPRPPA